MLRLKNAFMAVALMILWGLGALLPGGLMAAEPVKRVVPRGTLKVADLWSVLGSITLNYAEGLVTLDKDNQFAPCLADSWEWLDDRTMELRLRKGVSFQNGEPFNAEAVRVNYEAYEKLSFPTYLPYLCLQHGTALEIRDDFTVRFVFPEPDGLALVRLRWFFLFAPAFFSDNAFAERGWGYLAQPGPWGTGPFKLVGGSLAPDKLSDRVVLEAYENYWNPRYPKLERVIFDNALRKDRDEAVRVCRENEGELDIVSFIRPLDTLKVAQSSFAKVVKSRDSTHMHSAMNQRKENSKWRDIRLRKALNHALDREELMKYGAKGNAYNLGGHIPPGVRGYNPDKTIYAYDIARAKALLAEAGYPDGFEMTLITPQAQELEAQVMKRMYERIGLKVNLEVYTFGQWIRKVITYTEDMAQKQDWDVSVCYVSDNFGHSGAAHLVYPFLDAAGIRWIELDPVYEKMWHEMAGTVDEAAQDEKMRRIEQYIYDRAYVVFIYSPLNLYAVNKEVNFLPNKYQFLMLKETSVTEGHWSLR